MQHHDKIRIFGYKIPQYGWFVLSGSICDIIQAGIDYLISIIYVLEWEHTTVCWTGSYIISIWVRHLSHRMLVFGDYEGSYLQSLFRTYFTYSSSIVISMITNHILVKYLFFTHFQAWIITMLWTGIYNYFMLKASWKSGNAEKEKSSEENDNLLKESNNFSTTSRSISTEV
eukprot:gene10903-14635_t